MVKNDPFQPVRKAIDLDLQFLEEVEKLEVSSLGEDMRDFLFSQFRKTIGKLGNILLTYDKK